ncbi:DUF1822 family protein [Trichocoleus sp. FACHB-262]|uniref:DUF1822 family protein n=1 Tax=Trichocoleus sp. FACHB-262 TaxID=2692869 RepID=UPI00168372A1|nr:DUF1822 family protein [Trichocoleus sp. FACHB-262]MBD2121873.1 DUF1822 family protein [Trichocoleus sp. FACHB-262]
MSNHPVITIPLDQSAHLLAQKFSLRYLAQPSKAEQVYHNILCICAIYDYLSLNGFEANLEDSDSWDTDIQTLSDVADVLVVGLGKLECRPVLPGSSTVFVPAEIWWADRIGYVAVQLDRPLQAATQATILGFLDQGYFEASESEQVPLPNLKPPEQLLQYLELLQHPQPVRSFIHLSRWLEKQVEVGWEAVENLIKSTDIRQELAFRAWDNNPESVVRAQLLDHQLQLKGESVVLLVVLTPSNDQRLDIRVQVHPVGNTQYLPPRLKLMMLSESGEVMAAKLGEPLISESRDYPQDSFIQLRRFTYPLGKRFSIRVMLGEASVTRDFMV